MVHIDAQCGKHNAASPFCMTDQGVLSTAQHIAGGHRGLLLF